MEDVISRADAIRLIKNELGFLGSRETEAAVNVLQKMPAANTKAGGDGPAADIAQSICTESSFSTRDDTLPNS